MRVAIVDRRRAPRESSGSLSSFARRVAAKAPRTECTDLAIVLVGDRAMRRLNRRYRRKDRTTDVLSFPSAGEDLPDGSRPLGEIVISVPQAARQAAKEGHSLSREMRVLVIHGYLHLLGYDHEVDDGRMMRLQSRLASALLPAVR